jgi:hypothetical protein
MANNIQSGTIPILKTSLEFISKSSYVPITSSSAKYLKEKYIIIDKTI